MLVVTRRDRAVVRRSYVVDVRVDQCQILDRGRAHERPSRRERAVVGGVGGLDGGTVAIVEQRGGVLADGLQHRQSLGPVDGDAMEQAGVDEQPRSCPCSSPPPSRPRRGSIRRRTPRAGRTLPAGRRRAGRCSTRRCRRVSVGARGASRGPTPRTATRSPQAGEEQRRRHRRRPRPRPARRRAAGSRAGGRWRR